MITSLKNSKLNSPIIKNLACWIAKKKIFLYWTKLRIFNLVENLQVMLLRNSLISTKNGEIYLINIVNKTD